VPGLRGRRHSWYGTRAVFFLLSKILDLAFAPLTWVIVLVVLATVRRKTHPRRRRRMGIAAALILYVFALDPVSNRLVRSLEMPLESSYRVGNHYDAVVLLGGLLDSRPTVTYGQNAYNENIERLLTTFDLLRTQAADFVIISGGDADGSGIREADELATQLEKWGIARSRIIIEAESRNTRENATKSKAIAEARGFKKVLIVTSAFHMGRAKGCFNAVDMPVDTLSVDFRSYDPAGNQPWSLLPRANHFHASSVALRELSGRLVYRIRGYSK